MRLSTSRYSLCVCMQLTLAACDLLLSCASMFPRGRDSLLVLFITLPIEDKFSNQGRVGPPHPTQERRIASRNVTPGYTKLGPKNFGKEIEDSSIAGVLTIAEKRRRDTHSSPSPTLEPAPLKVDQRSSLNTDTPRSPPLESYTESTLDSTAYAALTVEAGEGGGDYFSPPLRF
ncbi:hypothetical protein EVAR_91198_1 [Eumeta japonica]|uniref:Uncharacterized protein n=1 Tax=Eumeta variegata TaxID=151549 RepID=A0A4C1ZID0_EUMVA|nr:hypothetical protein EVAR_91198_1 [Eumeta japonica]